MSMTFRRFSALCKSTICARVSNFACLAGKQALRLGCAALSAPPFALQTAVLEQQISLSPSKNKNTEHPNGYSVFLAEKERFELSRRLTRPTPLAGAPLHHLSISPYNTDRGSIICSIIIASFFCIVNSF